MAGVKASGRLVPPQPSASAQIDERGHDQTSRATDPVQARRIRMMLPQGLEDDPTRGRRVVRVRLSRDVAARRRGPTSGWSRRLQHRRGQIERAQQSQRDQRVARRVHIADRLDRIARGHRGRVSVVLRAARECRRARLLRNRRKCEQQNARARSCPLRDSEARDDLEERCASSAVHALLARALRLSCQHFAGLCSAP